ncbi:hypothetical protein [Halosegnis marinus]|uniref:Polymer-forming cytoskeletal protein n=1 Tax=Halosegnis marinus TaxID=3034023 RepID=A0ABD5ZPQ4_9EURY|nr:hypothetical protein [Halosegnis sp. DT85]
MADIERTRAVVEAGETFDGKVIPTVQAELDRPVRIREGATVQGSVYGATVETDADATVEGSVMAADAVELEGGRVHGEVGTPGKVVGSDATVEGTVTGKRVRLTDCVVRGNVVGTELVLENCVVLGIVTADRSLAVEDSLCYTFRSHGDTRLDGATTILPQAICDGPVELASPVTVAGLGELDVTVEGDEGDESDADDASGRLPEMTTEDLYDRGDTTYLTLAPRVLNLEKVTERLDELERAVLGAVDDTSGEGASESSVAEVLSALDVDTDAIVNTDIAGA